jgi:hypothetical protein
MYLLRKSDAFGIVLVTAVAVWQNLAIAVVSLYAYLYLLAILQLPSLNIHTSH